MSPTKTGATGRSNLVAVMSWTALVCLTMWIAALPHAPQGIRWPQDKLAQLGIILVVVTPFIGGQLVLVSLAPRMSAVSAYLANVFLGCVLTAIDYFQCGSGGCGKVWEGENGDIANQFIFRILIWAIVAVGLTMANRVLRLALLSLPQYKTLSD